MIKFSFATLAAAIALVCGSSAMAADIARPVYTPAPAPAPVYNWTGFYLGGAWGYGLWDADTSLTFSGFTSGVTNNGGRGWLGQAIAGYDYQFAVANWNLVAGVFADYDFGNVKGKFTASSTSFAGSESEKSFWSVGGRIGWLVTPQILSYWSGGFTEAHFDGVTFASTAGGAGTLTMPSHNYHGWFLGGGLEAQSSFFPGLFVFADYRFASYNQASLPLANTSANLNIHPFEQTIFSGLKYKFNWH
jgi:outer membrane immunogenic protein